jgi:hypothetical protein
LSVLFDFRLIFTCLEDISNPSKVEGEEENAVNSYHIKGKIPSESLRPITLSSVAGINVIVDVWINTENFLINQIRVEGQITETEKPGIVRILKLSNYDQEVEIESPM